MSEVAYVLIVWEVSAAAPIGERLRGLRHCKMLGYELQGVVLSFVLLDWLFFGLQTPFPLPLEFLQECPLALELLPYV